MELEGTSSLNSDSAVASMESMDWSFLDNLDSNAAENISDFRLFSDNFQDNTYMHLNLVDDDNDNDDDHDRISEGLFSHKSYLWNF